jgi:hypothetical protein
MFGNDIRAIIPHMAMSAGTMIALSCRQIVMGHHSSLGPVDPQIFGMPAHGIVEEFKRAREEIRTDPAAMAVWQPIIAKYPPTLVGECENAIKWSGEIVSKWLKTGMYRELPDDEANAKVEKVLKELADHAFTKSHSRHIGAERAREIGLDVFQLEDDQELQEKILTVHHAFVQTASDSGTIKIIENHMGVAHVSAIQMVTTPISLAQQPPTGASPIGQFPRFN